MAGFSAEAVSHDVGTEVAQEVFEQVYGKRERLENAARNAWDRLHVEKEYGRAEGGVKLILENTASRVFEAMRTRIDGGEQVRRGTHAGLAALDNLVQMTVAVGKSVKLRSSPYSSDPDKDVMDEEEMQIFKTYLHHIEELNTGDLIDLVDETTPFSEMLSEQMGEKTATLQMLNPQNPDYKNNIHDLRDFIRKSFQEGESLTPDQQRLDPRTKIKGNLWGQIVANMNEDQREDLVMSFMEEGPAGAKIAEEMLEMLVGTGKLSYQNVEAMINKLGDPKTGEASFNLVNHSALRKKLEAAREQHAENERVIEHAARQYRRSVRGNTADHHITFNNMVFGRIAELGLLTSLMNGMSDMALSWKEAGEGTTAKVTAIIKGFDRVSSNKYFYFGLAEAAAGVDLLSGGWVRKNILYGASRGEKERAQVEKGEERLRTIVEGYPGMEDFIEGRYKDFYVNASASDRAGLGFKVLPADMGITDKQYSAWGAKSEKGRQRVRDRFNEAIQILGETFGLKNEKEVQQYFKESDIGVFEPEPEAPSESASGK